MPKKRHSGITEADAALGRAFLTLELDDAPLTDPEKAPALMRRYRAALLTLILTGPLLCDFDADAFAAGGLMADEDVLRVRDELQHLFRSAVHGDPVGTPSSEIATYQALSFTVATVQRGKGLVKVLVVRARDLRDVIVLQSVLLLQQVGLSNVQPCAAPDCQRYFVKVYRREFCSKQCQKRINMRKQRQIARVIKERRAQRRRDRRRKGHVRHG